MVEQESRGLAIVTIPACHVIALNPLPATAPIYVHYSAPYMYLPTIDNPPFHHHTPLSRSDINAWVCYQRTTTESIQSLETSTTHPPYSEGVLNTYPEMELRSSILRQVKRGHTNKWCVRTFDELTITNISPPSWSEPLSHSKCNPFVVPLIWHNIICT